MVLDCETAQSRLSAGSIHCEPSALRNHGRTCQCAMAKTWSRRKSEKSASKQNRPCSSFEASKLLRQDSKRTCDRSGDINVGSGATNYVVVGGRLGQQGDSARRDGASGLSEEEEDVGGQSCGDSVCLLRPGDVSSCGGDACGRLGHLSSPIHHRKVFPRKGGGLTQFAAFLLLLLLFSPLAVNGASTRGSQHHRKSSVDTAYREYFPQSDDPFAAISGSLGPSRTDSSRGDAAEDEEEMLADSPFSAESFQTASRQGSYPSSPPPPSFLHRHSMDEIRREYGDDPFVQIYSDELSENLVVEKRKGKFRVGTTFEPLDKRALFQLTWRGKAVTLENVNSCRFLCMDRNGELYMTTSPSKDRSCYFTTSDSDSAAGLTLASVSTLTSRAHSNSTHSLRLSSSSKRKRKRKRPKGEYALKGAVETRFEFLFARVSFDDLRGLLKSEAVLRNIYRPAVRYKHYCPDVFRREKDKKKDSDAYGKRNCSAIEDRKEREKCREAKINRCLRKRTARKKKAMEMPCTASERRKRKRLRSNKVDKAKPWSATRNCSAMPLKSDRKVCRREKRLRCSKRFARKLPGYEESRLVEMCKEKQKLERCAKKTKDRSGCKHDLRMKLADRQQDNKSPKKRTKGKLLHMIPEDVKYL